MVENEVSGASDDRATTPSEPSRAVSGEAGIPRAERRLRLALERIVAATHSHIDGRDLLAELHPRKTLDIKRRVDGRETWLEGDWLSGVWSAVKDAKALLYSEGIVVRAAQGIAAGTGETAEQVRPEGQKPVPKGAPEPGMEV